MTCKIFTSSFIHKIIEHLQKGSIAIFRRNKKWGCNFQIFDIHTEYAILFLSSDNIIFSLRKIWQFIFKNNRNIRVQNGANFDFIFRIFDFFQNIIPGLRLYFLNTSN